MSEARKRNGKGTKQDVFTFRPMGPVREMINLAVRKQGYGARTRVMEDAIAEMFKMRFPKLYSRYEVLKEEKGA